MGLRDCAFGVFVRVFVWLCAFLFVRVLGCVSIGVVVSLFVCLFGCVVVCLVARLFLCLLVCASACLLCVCLFDCSFV